MSEVAVAASSGVISTETICTEQGFAALQSEWEELARCCSWLAAQTFAFSWVAWRTAEPGAAPAIIVARHQAKLVGVWPLFVAVSKGVRVASNLGAGGSEEYAGGLIEDGPLSGPTAAALVKQARRSADVLLVWNIKPEAPLALALKAERGFKRRTRVQSYVVGLREFASWQDWLKSKSRSFRQSLGGQRRGLAKAGVLESIEDDSAIIAYLFETKRKWLAERGKRAPWVESGAGERFYSELAKTTSQIKTFGLTLDGNIIAAGICMVGANILEYLMTTYTNTPLIAKFSPGMLVTEDCGRWAVAHGLDLDFRFVGVPYKERWMSRLDVYESFALATNARGAPYVAKMIFDKLLRQARGHLGGRIKPLLRRTAPGIARAGQ